MSKNNEVRITGIPDENFKELIKSADKESRSIQREVLHLIKKTYKPLKKQKDV